MSTILIEDKVLIPDAVRDVNSFRTWAHSPEFPEHGSFAFLDGQIWVDLSMEEFFSHNQVKAAFYFAIASLLQETKAGRFVPDRMMLSHMAANLSTEPDGLFATWETFQANRLQLIGGDEGCVELEGTPDMVLEVVSRSSVHKDNVLLRNLYWQAGIPEYWLVDARKQPLRFTILWRAADGYQEVEPVDGWLPSAVFARSFRLTQDLDPLGKPQFTVSVR